MEYPANYPITRDEYRIWLEGAMQDDAFAGMYNSFSEKRKRWYERQIRKEGMWIMAAHTLAPITLVITMIILMLQALLAIL